MEIIDKLGYVFLAINAILFFIIAIKGNTTIKILFFYLLLSLIIQLTSSALNSQKINNLFLTHYFFIGQFIILSFFFITLFSSKNIKAVIKTFLILVLISIAAHYYISPENYFKWSVFEILLTTVPLLFCSFLFLINKINSIDEKKYVYFISGFFVYTLCSTLIFSIGNIGTKQLKLYVWAINSSLYLLYQILITVEWFKNFRHKN